MATLLVASTAMANPTGGVVAAGAATIVPTTPVQLDINQSTNKAVINWASFNIAPTETTNFNQPNASSVTLNRIGGANPAQILGNLNANGKVMLVNPNGVFFGQNAQVNVGGLLATTADTTDANFMAATSKYAFNKAGKPNAQVVNKGTINVANGGYAALVGPTATNDGTITANLGKVALAGTDVFTLDLTGDKLINFSLPTGIVKTGPNGAAATANNNGTIIADEGKVQLSAKSATSAINSIVNMNGVIEAHSSNAKKGSVYLNADRVNIGGDIDVSGEGNADGGKIEATGGKYLAMTGNLKAEGGPDGGDGGLIHLQGNPLVLGGTASVAAGGGGGMALMGGGYGPKGGIINFKSGNVFDIGTLEAYTIADAVNHGGTINVSALKTINVNAPIIADGGMMALSEGYGHYKPNSLNFLDGNANYTLEVNLKDNIEVPWNTKLTGDASIVNVKNDKAEIQDGVDIASTAGADVNVYPGYYDENVHIDKNNINLHAKGAPVVASLVPPVWVRPVIDGYVNVTADNDTVNGFTIKGGWLPGTGKVGVNVKDGSDAIITNNHIELDGYGGGDELAAADFGGGGGWTSTGIKLTDAQNAHVQDNRISGADIGVSVKDSDNTVVTDNTILADKKGVDINDSSDVEVSFNNIEGSGYSYASFGEGKGHAYGHDEDATIGVYGNKAANVEIKNNNISGYETGVKLKDSHNAYIANNYVYDVTNGVAGDNTDNMVYDNNTLVGNNVPASDGLFLKDSSNAKVTNNTHTGFTHALRRVNSNTSVKTGNNF